MIKRILVPLEGSSYTDTATKHACDIARRTGAEVFGKAVIDESKAIWGTAPAHALAACYAAQTRLADLKEEKRLVSEVLELFGQTCTEAGVAHRKARLQGVPAEMVIEQSIFYDLVVSGFRGDYGIGDEDNEKSVGALLGTSITPFLIVPREYREIKNVLVCFDGSLPAMRSLQDFAVLAEASQFEITILTADKEEEEADFLLQRACDYLRSYGVKECRTVKERRPVLDVVFEASYYDESLDLIVAGAHSRNAVRDFFLGSFVVELLQLARTPVFIGQ